MRLAKPLCLRTQEFRGILRCFELSCAAFLLGLTFVGCGNSCFTGISNPGGTGTTVNSSCPFAEGNGTLTLWFDSSSADAAGSTSQNLKHVYVTLQGVEAHPNGTVDENSSDWRELVPELATHPVQVDLLAHTSDSSVSNRMARSVVPADVYNEIRLRIAPDRPAENGPAPEQNACGDIGLNCVVTTTGEVRPLSFDGAAEGLHIAPESITGGFFRVVPDQDTYLSIEFNPYASLAVPAGDDVRVIPIFTVTSSAPCDSSESSRNSAN